MIDLEFIERLIQAIDQSGLDSIEIERGGTRVRLSRTAPLAAAAPAATAAPAAGAPADAPSASAPPTPSAAEERSLAAAARLVEVNSPMVGTFFRAPAPDAPPYVEVGARIKKGDTLCIIEAMKLMNELEAELAGTVVEILVDNAEPVEYGQPLFRVDPV